MQEGRRDCIKKSKGASSAGMNGRRLRGEETRKQARQAYITSKRTRFNPNSLTSSTTGAAAAAAEMNRMDKALVPQTDVSEVSVDTIAQTLLCLPPQKIANHELVQMVQQLRQITASNDLERNEGYIAQIVQHGLVPVLIEMLASTTMSQTADSHLTREVIWCLSNIASGSSIHTEQVLPSAPYLIQHLSGEEDQLIEHAVWTLGNIAADCDRFRLQLHENGALAPLISLLKRKKDLSLVKTTAWALSNLARGIQVSGRPFFEHGILEPISTYLCEAAKDTKYDDVLIEIAWVLCFLSAKESDCLEHILNENFKVVPSLCVILDRLDITRQAQLLTPLLRSLGNISCGENNDWNIQILQHHVHLVIPKIALMLQIHAQDTVGYLIKEAIWVMANLLGTNLDAECHQLVLQQLIDEVRRANIPSLVKLQLQEASFDTRKQACICLCSLATLSSSFYDEVIQEETLQHFMRLLTNGRDLPILWSILDLIELMLVSPKSAEGHDRSSNSIELLDRVEAIETLENLQYQFMDEVVSAQKNGQKEHDLKMIADKLQFLVDTCYQNMNNNENDESSLPSSMMRFPSNLVHTADDRRNGGGDGKQSDSTPIFHFGGQLSNANASLNPNIAVVAPAGRGGEEPNQLFKGGVGRGSHLTKPAWWLSGN